MKSEGKERREGRRDTEEKRREREIVKRGRSVEREKKENRHS